MVLESIIEGLEHGFGEAGADLAYGLEFLGIWVVAAQQKAAIHRGAFPPAVVCTHDNEIHRVAQPIQVILLHLEPVAGPAGGLVSGVLAVVRFHHQTFTVVRDRDVKERLDVGNVVRVHMFGKVELVLGFSKRVMK